MALELARIPELDRAEPDAGRTRAGSKLPGTTARRTFLRAVALGVLTIGATALDWSGLSRLRRANAETGPDGMQGWDRNDCRDAYATGYPELLDTSGTYVNTYAACFGGYWRGSTYCEAGWHKYGTWNENGVQVDHQPLSNTCGQTIAKNAWRWTTPDKKVYRCSDGFSTFWGDGSTGQTYLTICRAEL
ncbi:hypothetical protein [Amycolatopsis sp. NPDC049159]|uniref:hypothetical protein n=1 Tax=unclassified Amycolatopsis TaxID=2618356 RepID=UPI0033DD45C8